MLTKYSKEHEGDFGFSTVLILWNIHPSLIPAPRNLLDSIPNLSCFIRSSIISMNLVSFVTCFHRWSQEISITSGHAYCIIGFCSISDLSLSVFIIVVSNRYFFNPFSQVSLQNVLVSTSTWWVHSKSSCLASSCNHASNSRSSPSWILCTHDWS